MLLRKGENKDGSMEWNWDVGGDWRFKINGSKQKSTNKN